ncbi:TPA: cob(I)yrinic acid a,c-diamide adenosyltransferase [Candidatus Berkelbacteria bacterium]|uniref:Cob(I)yrinic acid a,c-diamide adenosyltransferase, cob(I)alamin adenosyltransferase n=1 Tax=Berkelbacteria bacterium GW2011_GWE1_39_12 TaxID=1618337 RepID=A0A0G4B1X1_9BACT|nr:MAG: cob(I)yrinic acid a,c-diamide adenosyltransferase, cob(I)alamin adenosyltransferase [Berkelbacteria bacterium GW2011_GWE1_39_12]HBO60078.1 cob(I)yrinic acid a,c-diamide adenosyltransferase [Candidatus Berkelbacteria bacterium]
MIQIYTGDGKGKTTAALGLALRACGAGKKVALVQFLKAPKFSEHIAIKKYKLPIDVFAFGIGFYISSEIPRAVKQSYKIVDNHTVDEHRLAAKKGLLKAEELIKSKKYDIVIFDEINVAIGFKLLDTDNVIALLKTVPKNKEIILTGRKANAKIKKMADLVTEMKKQKHYFDKGKNARKGIEF